MARSLAFNPFTDADVRAQIAASNGKFGRRVELLTANGDRVKDLDVSAATVSLDTDRKIPGSLALTMQPEPALARAMFRYHIRPWYGITMPDGTYVEWPMGRYVWTVTDRDVAALGIDDWSITLPDLSWLLEASGPDIPGYYSAAGSTVYSHIVRILNTVGITDLTGVEISPAVVASEGFWGTVKITGVDPTSGLPTVAPGSPSPMTWLDVLRQLHEGAGGYPPWFDLSGRYRFTIAPDIRNAQPSFTYAATADSIASGFRTTNDLSLLANRVVGRANNAGGFMGLVIADADELLPNHPMAKRNLGFYMTKTLDFPTVGSYAELTPATNFALLDRLSRTESLTLRTEAMPAHEAYEFVGVQWAGDPILDTVQRYRERGWDLDLFSGDMTHTLYRAADDVPPPAAPITVQGGEGNPPVGTTGFPDLVITSARFDPASPKEGDHVDIYATVQNIGDTTTPAGTILDFAVYAGAAPDTKTLWSDTHTAALAAGASVELKVNSGEAGIGYWIAAVRGVHPFHFNVNSINRINEGGQTGNNTFDTTLNVIPATTGGGTTPPPPTAICESFDLSVSVTDYGALGDGITDDSAAVTAAVAAADTLGVPVFFPQTAASVYVASFDLITGVNLEGPFVPLNADGTISPLVTIKMPAKAVADNKPVVEAKNYNTISYLKIDGNRAQQPAFPFADAYNNAGSLFSVSAGQGRGFKAGIRGEAVTNLYVHHCEFTQCFGAAVATIDSSVVTLDHCYAHDTNFELLYAHGTIVGGPGFQAQSGTDITVTFCVLTNIGVTGAGYEKADGIVLSRVLNYAIDDNKMTSGFNRCFTKIESSSNGEVRRNNLTRLVRGTTDGDTGYPAFQFAPFITSVVGVGLNLPSSDIDIADNVVVSLDSAWLSGVQLNSANAVSTAASLMKNVTVHGNTFSGVHFGVLSDGGGLDNINIHDNAFNNLDLVTPDVSTGSAAIYQNGTGINTFQQANNTHDGVTMASTLDTGAFGGYFLN